MDSYRKFSPIEFYMNNRRREGEKSLGARGRRLGEF
jgi:hypothetical protein